MEPNLEDKLTELLTEELATQDASLVLGAMSNAFARASELAEAKKQDLFDEELIAEVNRAMDLSDIPEDGLDQADWERLHAQASPITELAVTEAETTIPAGWVVRLEDVGDEKLPCIDMPLEYWQEQIDKDSWAWIATAISFLFARYMVACNVSDQGDPCNITLIDFWNSVFVGVF